MSSPEIADTRRDRLDDSHVFKSPNIRAGFIRKVYSLLLLQLLVTSAIVSLAFTSDSVQVFVKSNPALFVLAMVASLALLYALGCYPAVARRVPLNYVLFATFTLADSYVVAYLTIHYDAATVLIAVLLTTVMVVSLSVYACFSNDDFTFLGGTLFVVGGVLLAMSLLAFFIRNRILQLVVAGLSVILLGIYLIYDTQMIVGDKGNRFAVDDYVFAAMALYVDITRIFLHILTILGNKG